MDAKHTPGPWGISSESPRIIKQYDSLGETNLIIASASGGINSGPCFPNIKEEVDANAARIVSCVNACDGVAEPETYPLAKMLSLADSQRKACFEYERRVDELLTTLKDLTDACGQWTGSSEALRIAHFNAHLELAKATGQ